jgi:predicted metal-dependent hydrolase
MPVKEQRQITLLGKSVTYQLRISERSNRVRISVSEKGVSLVLPSGFPLRDGEGFLQKNADWVLQQIEKHEKHAAKNNRASLPADVILLRGTPTRVDVIEEQQRKLRARVDESSSKLLIRIPSGASASVPVVLESWLRELARQEIELVVTNQSRRMQVRPGALTIRDQRTRWGSCSNRGTLSFNWRLVMVPPTVMEYVVIHELAHLSVPNHSAQFWSLVAHYYPAFKEARSWLRKNASLLHPKMLTDF